MSVARIWEAPRVTKPYSEAQWAAIDAAGQRHRCAALSAGDVRLTMGGEPTFVSSEDAHGAGMEHRGARREQAQHRRASCSGKLKERYAPVGLAHFGQGKWYPGEPLPRWSLNCFWRKDGEPIWPDRALIADETRRYPQRPCQCAAAARRGRGRAWASAPSMCSRPIEDAFYYLWRERKLPANVDRVDSKLADPLERARLRACSRATRATGRLCAADRPAGGGRPVAERPLVLARRALLPDSRRLADRLPPAARFAALGRNRPTSRIVYPPDPTQELRALASRRRIRDAAAKRRSRAARGEAGRRSCAPRCAPRRATACSTSSCRRRGRLEDYLELVAAVEASASALGQPVIIEGYEPPADPRLVEFQGHARSGRDRGQRAAERELGRARRAHHPSLRDRARSAAALGKIHARRPARRHRRRQPLRARRRDARRTRRSCGARICCAA